MQIIVIHGGDSFTSFGEFFVCTLRSLPRMLERALSPRTQSWKQNLQEVLGEDYEVIRPQMPSPHYAHYAAWKAAFEKLIPEMDDEVIVLGHSLGGSFLAKYLSENHLPKRIRATFLVAAPFDADGGRVLAEFNIVNDLSLLRAQGGDLFLYHSTDDPVVDFAELAKFRTHLPEAHVRTFSNQGHFIGSTFPELVADIEALDRPVDNVHE